MDNFKFENQGTNTYLVYTIAETDELDTMTLGMITNNNIAGLAEAVFTQQDENKYIKYNVSSKVSMKQFFSGSVNRRRVLGVFNGIVNAMLSSEDYMIDSSSILLDMDYIFADVSTCDTVLICLPITREQTEVNLGAFFKNLMFNTQFDQTENCDYVAQIINYLNSVPTFSVAEFKKLLDKLTGTAVPQAAAPSAGSGAQRPSSSSRITPPQKPQGAEQPQGMHQPLNVQQMPGMQQPMQGKTQQPAWGMQQPGQGMQQPGMGKPQQPAWSMPQPQGQGMQQPGQGKPQQPMWGAPIQQPGPGQQNFGKNGGAQPNPQGPRLEDLPTIPPEEIITKMYLLQHYSKENAAKYKQQQEILQARKEAEKAMAAGGMPPKDAKGKKKQKGGKGNAAPNFAVPGAQAAPGFAIPGREIPMAAPSNPNQQPAMQNQGMQNTGMQNPAMPNQPMQNRQMPNQPAQQPQKNAFSWQQPVNTPAPAQNHMPAQSAGNFGETMVLSGGTAAGETTDLGDFLAKSQSKPYLVRRKNNEKIFVDKPVFRIGKERSYVDYFIADNPAISRSHANIVNEGGSYFVEDTNSLNHTYVNGEMVPSGSRVSIGHGATICLANEFFEFKLY